MLKEIKVGEAVIFYDLQYKKVKNINLRIKSDGSVHVSANRWTSLKTIESFIISKSEFILRAIERCESRKKEEKQKFFSEDEIKTVIKGLCDRIYPYYERLGIKYPTIKFRRMVSQWGNCRSKEGILTFNLNLMYAPIECIEYAVAHEFTHFLRQDHSKFFYAELSKIMPDFKKRRDKLKKINIR